MMPEGLLVPKAVCYKLGDDTPKGSAVQQILTRHGIGIVPVTEKDLNRQIGEIIGAAGFDSAAQTGEQSERESLTEPFLLMCFFTKKLLDEVLADMKQAGVYIPLKGMLTGTNIGWKLGDLIAEISKEHAYMTGQRKK